MAQLKISDLSVGDWVRVDDFDKVLIKRVSAIDGTRNQIGIIKNNRSGIYWYYEDEIEPIPLTPEILEKNGFVKNGEYNEWNIGTWETPDLIGVSLERPSIIVKHKGTSIFLDQAKYTHQLQHALRLAGVEKEIIL